METKSNPSSNGAAGRPDEPEDILAPMEFSDVNLRQAPVWIGRPREAGGVRQVPTHFLVEASESDICEWTNRKMAAIRMAKGEVTGIGKMADTDPFLLSKCLRHAGADGEPGDTVKLDDIFGWPDRVVKPLVKRAKKLCGVDDDQVETVEDLRKERDRITAKIVALEKEKADSLAEAEGKS